MKGDGVRLLRSADSPVRVPAGWKSLGCYSNSRRRLRLLAFLLPPLFSARLIAQPVIPSGAIQQLLDTIGNRVEALAILGGDYGAAGGIYTFRGGTLADLSVSKVGGGGNVADRRPLGIGCMEWAPVFQGNVGFISAENKFENGFLEGNRMEYDTFAAQVGGGARFYFTRHLNLTPTISGIYGHVENIFHAENATGQGIK